MLGRSDRGVSLYLLSSRTRAGAHCAHPTPHRHTDRLLASQSHWSALKTSSFLLAPSFPVHPYIFPWVHPRSMRTNRKKRRCSEMEMPWWWMGLRARYWCRGMRDGPAWGEVRDGLAGRSGKKCSLIIGTWLVRIFCSLILALYDDHHITIVLIIHFKL